MNRSWRFASAALRTVINLGSLMSLFVACAMTRIALSGDRHRVFAGVLAVMFAAIALTGPLFVRVTVPLIAGKDVPRE